MAGIPGDAARAERQRYYDQFLATWDSAAWDPRTLERLDLARPMMAPGGSLLVVGAGGGAEPMRLREWGYQVTVIDIASVGVEGARQAGLAAFQVDLETDGVPGQYDQVACFEVLEHLRDPASALAKLRGALKPGGRLLVGLPNEFHVVRRLQVLAGRPDFAQHDWPHLRFFNYRACRRLFEEAGLEVRGVAAAPLVPPRMRMLRGIGRLLCRTWPGLFAFSYIFHLGARPQ